MNDISVTPPMNSPILTHSDLVFLRRRMLKSGTYTGDPSLLDNVHWRVEEGKKVLMLNNKPDERACLSIIMAISPIDFHMTADGDWVAPTARTPEIADIRAVCIGIGVEADPLLVISLSWRKTLKNCKVDSVDHRLTTVPSSNLYSSTDYSGYVTPKIQIVHHAR